MKNLSKKEALALIHKCAVAYSENLVHKNILFVTVSGETASCFEAAFLPRNFPHLTGVRTKMKSTNFFDLAVKNRLKESDIELPSDGTATLKLAVLPSLMNIHLNARMAGDFDFSKSLLVTDKIAGTVIAAMGFVKNGSIYVPNTALNTDVRDITVKPVQRIAAIFIKGKHESKYSEQTYIAKGITLDEDSLKRIINEKVSVQETPQ